MRFKEIIGYWLLKLCVLVIHWYFVILIILLTAISFHVWNNMLLVIHCVSGTGLSSGVNFAIPIDTVVQTVPYLIVYGTPYSDRFWSYFVLLLTNAFAGESQVCAMSIAFWPSSDNYLFWPCMSFVFGQQQMDIGKFCVKQSLPCWSPCHIVIKMFAMCFISINCW